MDALSVDPKVAKRALASAIAAEAKKGARDIVVMARDATWASVRYLESVVVNTKKPDELRISAAGKLLALGWGAAPTKILGQLDLNVNETKVLTAADIRQAALRLVKSTAEDAA